MTIYTFIRDTITGEQIKEKCDHKNWTELINTGWVFVGMSSFYIGHVLMSRNGYINEFWEVIGNRK